MSGKDATSWWELAVRGGKLRLHGVADAPFDFDIEDGHILGEHTVDVIAGPPARVFLDGYEVWSSDVGLSSQAVGHQGTFTTSSTPAGADQLATCIRDTTTPPRPMVAFAAMRLSDSDARAAGALGDITIAAKFRVRGPGQYGTIFAATRETEVLSARIAGGIDVRVGSVRATANGDWSDGRWHHLAVSVTGGAIRVWVDGWLCAHEPGSLEPFDAFYIGQDPEGQRLMGEVAHGGIYPPLNDQQIALLAQRLPLSQVPVFDAYPTGAFHRIPALVRTTNETLLAFADRRRSLPNDAPNATDLVLRRSHDGGRSWGEVITVATFPGEGAHGVAVTDACAVQDRTGKIHVLADFYAAQTGLLTCAPGPGMDEAGIIVQGERGAQYRIPENWPSRPTRIVSEAGPTEWEVDADGTLLRDGHPAGNILHNADIQLLKTAHIATWTSDDEGATWSGMRLITDEVKDEWMTFLGVAPGSGLCLTRGPFAGRLLIPAYFSTEDSHQHSATMLISDDDGRTWRRGGSVRAAIHASGKDGVGDSEASTERNFTDPALTMTESTIVETERGVELFARSQHQRVLRSLSTDGGQTWTAGREEPQLREIFCQPAACTDDATIYFANASRMLPYRGCGSLYRADGEGWTERAINPRHHGYQSLVAMEGAIGMLWERETAGIWFTAIPTSIFVH
ncbi:sialidase family protein [Trueperella pecoris]|uniref:exo-alpha-sialidase n=1 Tax=Trueperella pecoris TaxID=2733571 RepID=A0A7M1QW66_9ACTO|nr:sialidase family protein [Trueperella pecoris]QOR46081.1 exo-alpha-sialidase [Trueperella pecoris]QTG75913.1 exo-alpha-sialidase [Trueperella pecoris]